MDFQATFFRFFGKFYKLLLLFSLVGCRHQEQPIPCLNTPIIFSTKPIKEKALPGIVTEGVSLQLAQLLDIALLNNPVTERAWSETRSAYFEFLTQEAPFYPQVDLTEEFSYFDIRETFKPSPATGASSVPFIGSGGVTNFTSGGSTSGVSNFHFRTYQTTLTINYLILDFGGRCANLTAFRRAFESTFFTQLQTYQDVIQQVLDAYYNYYSTFALVEARELDLKDSEVDLDYAKKRFEAGVATIVDVYQAESNYAQSLVNLTTAVSNFKIAEADLSRAIGLPASVKLNLAKPQSVPYEEVTHDITLMMENSLVNRNDLKAKLATYFETIATLRVQESNSWPTLTGGADLSRSRFFGTNLITSHTYQSFLSLNVPIFHGFYYSNQIQKARADVCAAFADLKDTELSILLDVLTNYYQFEAAVENVKNTEQFLQFATKSYTATLESYKMGVSSFIDLLATHTVLSDARAEVIQAKTNVYLALVGLAHATGELSIEDLKLNSRGTCCCE